MAWVWNTNRQNINPQKLVLTNSLTFWSPNISSYDNGIHQKQLSIYMFLDTHTTTIHVPCTIDNKYYVM